MNIILLGMAGSGKGTQAKLMAKKFGLTHISMGDLLREEAKKDNELGKKIKEIISKGELITNEITLDLIRKKVEGNFNNIVFDGYPRSLEQAQALDAVAEVNFVISLEIPDELAIERLSKRRQCRECGEITTDKYEKCTKCQGELYQRKDDEPEAIKKRLEIYHEEVEPLKEYYKPRELVHIIDGTGTVEEIFEEITKIINNK